jgi:hypothetical protein
MKGFLLAYLMVGSFFGALIMFSGKYRLTKIPPWAEKMSDSKVAFYIFLIITLIWPKIIYDSFMK